MEGRGKPGPWGGDVEVRVGGAQMDWGASLVGGAWEEAVVYAMGYPTTLLVHCACGPCSCPRRQVSVGRMAGCHCPCASPGFSCGRLQQEIGGQGESLCIQSPPLSSASRMFSPVRWDELASSLVPASSGQGCLAFLLLWPWKTVTKGNPPHDQRSGQFIPAFLSKAALVCGIFLSPFLAQHCSGKSQVF